MNQSEMLYGSADDYVESLNSALVDRALIAFTVFALFSYGIVLLRSATLGFGARDAVQLVLVICVTVLTVMRNRISMLVKRGVLVAVLFASGLSGLLSLGLMAGTILLFPVLFVVLATLYRGRIAVWYSLITTAVFATAAVHFRSGEGGDITALLASSYPHWAVYIACIICFFLVSYNVIYTYKEQTRNYYQLLETRNRDLAESNRKLEKAMGEIRVLEGLLPICSHCKKVRDDNGYWNQIEEYISDRSPVMFSHSICHDCMEKYYSDLLEEDEGQGGEDPATAG